MDGSELYIYKGKVYEWNYKPTWIKHNYPKRPSLTPSQSRAIILRFFKICSENLLIFSAVSMYIILKNGSFMETDDYGGCNYDDDNDDDVVQVIGYSDFTDDFDSSCANELCYIFMGEDYGIFSWTVFEELMVLIGLTKSRSSLSSF